VWILDIGGCLLYAKWIFFYVEISEVGSYPVVRTCTWYISTEQPPPPPKD